MARSPACCRGQEARGRLSLTHATTWQRRGSEVSSPALMPSAAGSPVPQSAGLALLCYQWWLIMREIWQRTNPVSTQTQNKCYEMAHHNFCAAGASEGASLADPKLQDLCFPGQQDIQEKYQWGPCIKGITNPEAVWSRSMTHCN